MTIERFDRKLAAALGKELEQAVQSVAAKYGMEIRSRGGQFGDSSFTAKLECTIKNASGVGGRRADAFKELCSLFGMEQDDLGKDFAIRGRLYKVVGLMAGAGRAPILGAAMDNGKTYRFEAETILAALGKKPKYPTLREVPLGESLLVAPKKATK